MGPCASSPKEYKIHKISTMKDNTEQAQIQLKTTRDNIKSYMKRLRENEKQKREKAKEALKNKDRDRAKMFLTQAKMYKEQSNSAQGSLVIIEEQITQIETAKVQKDVVKVLEQGNSVLKKLNEEVNIEKWEKIADDMNEIKAQQDEIGNFFKNHNINYEEEVDKELEDLMKLENKQLEDSLPQTRNNNVVVSENKKVAVLN
jgi:charged multivesicular body protein 6